MIPKDVLCAGNLEWLQWPQAHGAHSNWKSKSTDNAKERFCTYSGPQKQEPTKVTPNQHASKNCEIYSRGGKMQQEL